MKVVEKGKTSRKVVRRQGDRQCLEREDMQGGQAGHVAKDCPNPLKRGKGEIGGKGKGEPKGGPQTGGSVVSGKGYKSGVDMCLASGKGAKGGKGGRGGGTQY